MTAPDPTEALVDDDASDRLAVAYWTGHIDHKHGRPRRVDLADRGPIATAYHHGYDHNNDGGGEAA